MTSAGILQRILRLRLLALTVVAVMSIGTNGQTIASKSLPVMVTGSTPKGWQIFDEIKQFTPENLYEQINGRAAFFLAYDMIQLTYVSFAYGEETCEIYRSGYLRYGHADQCLWRLFGRAFAGRVFAGPGAGRLSLGGQLFHLAGTVLHSNYKFRGQRQN